MDSDTIRAYIQTSVRDTLEQMLFAELFPCDSEETAFADTSAVLWSRVELTSPVTGYLSLEVPSVLVQSWGQELFGLDESQQDPGALQDVLCELLNTIAGRFMTLVSGEGTAFSIGLPQGGVGAVSTEGIQFAFQVDDQVCRITLSGDVTKECS